MIFATAMSIPKKSVRNVLQNSTAAAGCMANSYHFHGTIHDTYDIGCEMQRKRVECAIMIKAALADEASARENEERK